MANASLQQVLRASFDHYQHGHRLTPRQWQVCHHILDCRTEALGGVRLACEHCGQNQPHYFACRDRHCPRCQRRASMAWCERQQAAVLPVTYHHLVVTLPHDLNPWVQLHPEVIYGLLFETVWATLSTFAADPKRLDGQIGMTAVLHTWGQTLTQHVHLHCLVPGGALSASGEWHPAKSTYLFPLRALSRHVRGGYVSRLRQALQDGKLPHIEDSKQVDALLDRLMAADWVVYSKPCIARTETVVDYLGRYSHRIALSDHRILAIDDDCVQLDYKDYRDGDRHKVLTLSGDELIRRFLLHVLPKGFMRIRHFGWLANRCRARRLAEVRVAIDAPPQDDASEDREQPAPFAATPARSAARAIYGSSPSCHRNDGPEADDAKPAASESSSRHRDRPAGVCEPVCADPPQSAEFAATMTSKRTGHLAVDRLDLRPAPENRWFVPDRTFPRRRPRNTTPAFLRAGKRNGSNSAKTRRCLAGCQVPQKSRTTFREAGEGYKSTNQIVDLYIFYGGSSATRTRDHRIKSTS